MVENRSQLEQVLRGRLGAAFARHAYGMRRWVDLFAVRIPEIKDAYLAELVAEIVHNNARHARLFRERAIAHGVNPDLYVCPPEGEATYDGMPHDTDETLAYALGSLEHFGDLLAVYAEVAESARRRRGARRGPRRQRPCDRAAARARAGIPAAARPPPPTSCTACASSPRRRCMPTGTDSAHAASFAELQRDLPASSPRAWRFRALAAASRAGALLSEGLRVGHEHGFDSGPFMDHVYGNEPRGRTALGREIDRRLLRRRTCQAFREIRVLAREALDEAVAACSAPAPVVADLAAGPAPYVFEVLAAHPRRPRARGRHRPGRARPGPRARGAPRSDRPSRVRAGERVRPRRARADRPGARTSSPSSGCTASTTTTR